MWMRQEHTGRRCQSEVSPARRKTMSDYEAAKDRLTVVWWQCFQGYEPGSSSLSFTEN